MERKRVRIDGTVREHDILCSGQVALGGKTRKKTGQSYLSRHKTSKPIKMTMSVIRERIRTKLYLAKELWQHFYTAEHKRISRLDK